MQPTGARLKTTGPCLNRRMPGGDYLHSVGVGFPLRNACYVAAGLVAIRTNRAWFHALFVIAGIAFQLYRITRQFGVL